MQPRVMSRDVRLANRAAQDSPHLEAREKPYNINNMALPIALAVVYVKSTSHTTIVGSFANASYRIPLVIIIGVLLYLHRRNVRKVRQEEAKSPHRHLDFGLDDEPLPGGKKKKGRKSMLLGGEKMHKTNQLSMDMNLSSPYLLPPGGANESHTSVHELTRAPSEFDPYRMVDKEVASIRSIGREGSVFGGASKRASVITGRSVGTYRNPTRQGSFPKPGPTPPLDEKADLMTPMTPLALAATRPGPEKVEVKEPVGAVQPVIPEIGTVPYLDDDASPNGSKIPDIQAPPIALAKSPEDRLSSPPLDHSQHLPGTAQSDNIGLAYPLEESPYSHANNHQEPAGLGLNFDLPKPMSPVDVSPQPDTRALDSAPASHAVSTPDNRRSKDSYYEDEQPQIRTSQYYDNYEDVGRGRPSQRQASLEYYGEPQKPQQGLGVPAQDNKRLSVGFRPLPPDEALESEDPEYRANRIRSFYKEYFEDSSQPAPPMPQRGPESSAQYYEDYDERYLGESATYFDPDTNAFVMPYAQPVHRRAMTPPPAGRRGPGGPGPRGPPRGGSRGPRPHGPHGSVGGMSLPGGPRSRAGSAAAWGSRAPSSLGPRPDSSASARYGRQTPRKQLPPPAALSTLPTPSKLKDDSFALMNAMDFAPPETYGERARGRSQSPLGERRPYQPKVPSASPLVNSYDELNALPSP